MRVVNQGAEKTKPPPPGKPKNCPTKFWGAVDIPRLGEGGASSRLGNCLCRFCEGKATVCIIGL